ncbi:hypothetical protein GCM10007079_27530 [Nocardiopsis terrae]|uniref:Primosomal replication protein N n=1 Tax=Nocardiopsis terrae TaxID=372655 RepID=A0ABR9HF29_9ACTN|nr:hypothetical protein [Nocardiopsis terrae]MBE1457643.1 primosomal replication protein N [Nocardiopsis terrae]GHC85012.1 hypothetical protein GCM10007079_27530 [Nocardiopsis terrae]
MEPFSMVIGVAIAIGGFLAGRHTANRRARQELQQHQNGRRALPRGQQTPQPICGCGHNLVFHDQETKRCQTQVVIPGRWTGQATSTYRQCMCQGYRGPVPVDEYYAPDYLDGTN